MHYTLHQLRIFLAVAENESITKAAEELHLTQPAVSIQLRKLQDQLQVPLVEIIGRKLHLTEFGKDIAEASRKILNESNLIRDMQLAHRGLLSGNLRISIVSTGKYIMPYFLNGFLRDNPEIELTMDVTNKTTVIRHLEENSVDFVLVSVLPENIAVERVKLMSNRLYLVRKRQGSGKSVRLKPSDLQNQPFIFREMGSATRQAMERFMKEKGIHSPKQIALTSNEAVKQAVLAGLGYTVTPLIGIKNELMNEQIEIVEIAGLPITTTWNLIWLKGKRLSPVSKAFLEFVGENKSDIIDEQFSWYEDV